MLTTRHLFLATKRVFRATAPLFIALAVCGVPLRAASELVNISIRTQVGNGDSVLIAGFVISGTGTRPLLVRAVGPTLTDTFGITGTLTDPQVGIYSGGSEIAFNDDWNNDADLAAAFARLGAFNFTAGSRDAAALAPLAPGVYTAIASGKNGGTGDMLLEVYDAKEGTGPVPVISNLSLRGDMPAGGVMITGFVVSGDTPKRLLVRAIGPSLRQFGLEDVVENPRVRLYRGSTEIAVNDEWGQASNADSIDDITRTVGAFPLARGSQDAAVLTNLLPGPYTLHVSGADSGVGGVILVELYNADPDLAPPPTSSGGGGSSGLPQITVYTDDSEASETGDPGRVIFYRSGATTQPLTLNLQWSGTATAGVDFTALPATVTIPAGSSQTSLTIAPLTDPILEQAESVVVTVTTGEDYETSDLDQAGVIIADGPYSGLVGWRGEYFNSNNHSGTPVLTRTDAAIDFEWEDQRPDPAVRADNFSVRWTGVIIPDATKDYTFIFNGDDQMRIWIDDQLIASRTDYDWRDAFVTIPLVAGVPRLVRVEFIEQWGWASAKLWWAASGMSARPITDVAEPSAIGVAATGLDRDVAIVGEPFVASILSTGNPTSHAAAGLPPGLGLNTSSGVISGTPTTPGDYLVWLDATQSGIGGSAQVLLRVIAPGGNATRETFGGTPAGTTVPYGLVPTTTSSISSVEVNGGGGPMQQRLRGYITAPMDGAYRFWLSASGPAEFRFADSDQPGDRMLRARVSGSTALREWAKEGGQASPPLLLEAGQRYYFEIVHAQTTASGHVSLGWLKPGESGLTPFEVVPGYVLSPYEANAALADGSTVYVATMRAPAGVATGASGVTSIVLSPDQTTATLAMRFSGLSSDATNIQVYYGDSNAGPDLPVQPLPRTPTDEFSWPLTAVGGLTPADLVAALAEGNLFVLIQTGQNPLGEIRGQLVPARGSAEFQPPPAPPALAAGLPAANDVSRFLNQATFGPSMAEIDRIRQIGYGAWLDEQFAAAHTRLIPWIQQVHAARLAEDPEAGVYSDVLTEAWWQAAVKGDDQLRQRVTFALSEILVVSTESNVGQNIYALGNYYDMLGEHAFGNFRDILHDVTLSPTMGVYLSMLRNRKPDPTEGVFPDENYAREVMQLFSIGLHKLHPDGSLILDSRGLPIPTYQQETIVGLAHVFTGWTFTPLDEDYYFLWDEENFNAPMFHDEAYHDEEQKLLLDAEVAPAGQNGTQELEHVIDMLFNHPNTGPFISRLLIQRLVTSNPSPAYVYRVAQKFNNNGSGVRGDMKAVITAILTDWEARSAEAADLPGYGKLREPLIRIAHLWRAFDAQSVDGDYNMAWIRDWLGQEPLQSPTVFNFFQPDYIAPGPAATAGLVAPEFQVATDNYSSGIINQLQWLSTRIREWTEDTVLDVDAERALVATPDALLDRLDVLLFSGAMSPDARTQFRRVITDLPSWYDDDERVRHTIFTMVTSPDFAIQK